MWVVKVETNISGNDVVTTFDTGVSMVHAFLLFLDAVYPEEAVVVHAHYLVLCGPFKGGSICMYKQQHNGCKSSGSC
jgi:hypothetical protein